MTHGYRWFQPSQAAAVGSISAAVKVAGVGLNEDRQMCCTQPLLIVILQKKKTAMILKPAFLRTLIVYTWAQKKEVVSHRAKVAEYQSNFQRLSSI